MIAYYIKSHAKCFWRAADETSEERISFHLSNKTVQGQCATPCTALFYPYGLGSNNSFLITRDIET